MINASKKGLYKSFTWPIVHVFFVGGLIYVLSKLLTGEAEWEYVGFGAISYLALEMSFYYLHEKIWERIKGK